MQTLLLEKVALWGTKSCPPVAVPDKPTKRPAPPSTGLPFQAAAGAHHLRSKLIQCPEPLLAAHNPVLAQGGHSRRRAACQSLVPLVETHLLMLHPLSFQQSWNLARVF